MTWLPVAFHTRQGQYENPADLSRAQLVEIVRRVQELLYLDLGQEGDYWNPAKDWGNETIEEIAQVLKAHGLVPTEDKPAY